MLSLIHKQIEEMHLAGQSIPSSFDLIDDNGGTNRVVLTYCVVSDLAGSLFFGTNNPRLEDKKVDNDIVTLSGLDDFHHVGDQYLDAGSRALNIHTNGGLSIVMS